MLQRERHVVEERATAPRPAGGHRRARARGWWCWARACPTSTLPEAIRRIRASPATRDVSVLVLLPGGGAGRSRRRRRWQAGANAVLRRPLDRAQLEAWLAKLLIVPRRVEARVPVQGQVVGTPRRREAVHFYGLTRNLSVNGMLLASPVRLPTRPTWTWSSTSRAWRAACGRWAAWCARRARWAGRTSATASSSCSCRPTARRRSSTAGARRPAAAAGAAADASHGIHSTVRREDWVYEILEPVRHESGWQAEIRRAPRASWRPGRAGPFYVVEGRSRESVLREARDFLAPPSAPDALTACTPRVSVLLPVRDARRTLAACLRLARRPDPRRPRGGGGRRRLDATAARELLEAAAARATRACAWSRTPARGLVAALNHGLGAARAPLLARMDADDVAHPERLGLQAAAPGRGRPTLDVAGLRACGWSAGARPRNDGMRAYVEWLNGLLDHDAIARDLFVESPLAHPSVMMRTARAARARRLPRRSTGPRTTTSGCARRGRAALRQASGGAARLARRAATASPARTRATRADRFLALKLEALRGGPAAARPRRSCVWGAGPIGKALGARPARRAATRGRVRGGRPAQDRPAHPRRAGRGRRRRGRRSRAARCTWRRWASAGARERIRAEAAPAGPRGTGATSSRSRDALQPCVWRSGRPSRRAVCCSASNCTSTAASGPSTQAS